MYLMDLCVARRFHSPTLLITSYRWHHEPVGGKPGKDSAMCGFYDYTHKELIELQIEQTRRRHPDVFIPNPPRELAHWTPTEVPLLYLPSTAPALWRSLVVPLGYAKTISDPVKAGLRTLRFVPRKPLIREATWLAYNPEHGRGVPPREFTQYTVVAGVEVLAALNHLPGLLDACIQTGTMPIMSACRLGGYGDWRYAPRLHISESRGEIELRSVRVDEWAEEWVSPTIRMY